MSERPPEQDRSGLLGRILPRTGTEPVTARSPLRLRLLLALCFTPLFAAGAVLFWTWSGSATASETPAPDSLRTLAWICTGLAVFALVDLLIVLRRLRRDGGH